MGDGKRGVIMLMGGDFNVRTGREGGGLQGEEEGRRKNSRDEKINRENKKLVELIEEREWSIFNGIL